MFNYRGLHRSPNSVGVGVRGRGTGTQSLSRREIKSGGLMVYHIASTSHLLLKSEVKNNIPLP